MEKILNIWRDSKKIIIVFLVLAGLCFLIGFWLGGRKGTSVKNAIKPIRMGESKLTNPLLECELGEAYLTNAVRNFKYEIEEYIEDRNFNNDLSHISIYYRDLNNGPWFGINEEEAFTPASLLKVPLMIAYLKKAEEDPALLSKEVVYENKNSEPVYENIVPRVSMERGKKYTVEEIIRIMIIYSDNKAAQYLLENVDQGYLDKIYIDLGVTKPDSIKPENYMTVREYASFFRILFNASYLEREMSEKALEILSQSDFKEGLTKGLPSDITVAHKFGERKYNNLKQLHDCGIVYYQTSPYLLCIMTRGDNFVTLEKTIADISKKVYEETLKESRNR